jgi:Putative peptidoglycan binding domain
MKENAVLELGCFDPDVTKASCDAYLDEVKRLTKLDPAQITEGVDALKLRPVPPGAPDAKSVRTVQQALKALGFFPGGKDDGICGYRTQSAIRLFQEHVRVADKAADLVPDGRFGPQTQQHLQRWQDEERQPGWASAVARWQAGDLAGTEYGDWLALLDQVKAQYGAQPRRMLQVVNDHNKASDTRKVAQWDFSPKGSPQLIGIRRNEFTGKFDDIFVLLIKGLVFKFQGTTEPGATANPQGLPFLVLGQHDYHFGWHRERELALRPASNGVLVVRTKNLKGPDDGDLGRGLEANPTINVHWGGLGMARDIGAVAKKSWSEGCQVIPGTVYFDDRNTLVSCASFAAANKEQLGGNPAKTRGAFNVLVDLVTALASDAPDGRVRYMLLAEQDLSLAPALGQLLAEARSRVATMKA